MASNFKGTKWGSAGNCIRDRVDRLAGKPPKHPGGFFALDQWGLFNQFQRTKHTRIQITLIIFVALGIH
jgi:hypothetical protein